MSLKQILYQEIKSRGSLTLNQIESICHEQGYKISNAERRLRELMANGSISPTKNSKGAIIGYCKAQNCDYSGFQPKVDTRHLETKPEPPRALFDIKQRVKSPYEY